VEGGARSGREGKSGERSGLTSGSGDGSGRDTVPRTASTTTAVSARAAVQLTRFGGRSTFLLKLVAPEMGDATSSRCVARVNGANSSITAQSRAPHRTRNRLRDRAPSNVVTGISFTLMSRAGRIKRCLIGGVTGGD
jgi:hypothetical protein